MAGHRLTAAYLSSDPIGDYLAELETLLRGPRRHRRRILAEIRDGLTETVDARIADGTAPDQAAAAAIAEFGDPQTVAGSFSTEIATATARHTIAAFLLTGPLVGIWWLLLLHPTPWSAGFTAVLVAIPVLPVVALAIGAAAATFATTGRLIRWLPETTAIRALAATIAIASLCLVADLTVLGILTAQLATGRHYPIALAAIAAAASILRIGAAIAVIRSRHGMRNKLRHE